MSAVAPQPASGARPARLWTLAALAVLGACRSPESSPAAPIDIVQTDALIDTVQTDAPDASAVGPPEVATRGPVDASADNLSGVWVGQWQTGGQAGWLTVSVQHTGTSIVGQLEVPGKGIDLAVAGVVDGGGSSGTVAYPGYVQYADGFAGPDTVYGTYNLSYEAQAATGSFDKVFGHSGTVTLHKK